MSTETRTDAIAGCILGTAVGDALGLPFERITPSRQLKLSPVLDGPNFVLGRGLLSDDTEHTCLVAAALIESAGEVEVFERVLAHGLKRWFLALPPGTGLATLKACARLCIGVTPQRSGIFSAGNGPAMRSALLGVCCDGDFEQLQKWVHHSTRLTHTDPKAEVGAYAIALAGFYAAHVKDFSPSQFVAVLEEHLAANNQIPAETAREALHLIDKAVESAARAESALDFASSLGLSRGVSGYIFHTVPVVLQVWFKKQDYRTSVTEIVRAGGDADSTGAILGALIGVGDRGGIPREWIDRLIDRPLSVERMEVLSSQLAEVCETGRAAHAPGLPYALSLVRNIGFFVLVLGHVVRRMLPPY